MNFKYEVLFTVQFRHQYFDNALFNGFTFTPTDRTQQLMRRYRLVFKIQPGGFFIGYDAIEGESAREEVLKIKSVLSFRVNLTDTNLYNYTDNFPQEISGSIFHFKNFTIPEKSATVNNAVDERDKLQELEHPESLAARDLLVEDAVAGEHDIDNRPAFNKQYFSRPFAQVSIFIHSGMPDKFEVGFAAKATYWQYILLSEHLLQLHKPAVINKSTHQAFDGPVPVTMPENRQGVCFTSQEPVMLTSTPNRMFCLVENYEPGNDRYKIVTAFLPNPDISMISFIANEPVKFSKKKYSNIIL